MQHETLFTFLSARDQLSKCFSIIALFNFAFYETQQASASQVSRSNRNEIEPRNFHFLCAALYKQDSKWRWQFSHLKADQWRADFHVGSESDSLNHSERIKSAEPASLFSIIEAVKTPAQQEEAKTNKRTDR